MNDTHDPRQIAIDLIDVPEDRARAYDDAEAQVLASAIDAQGLFHAIRLRSNGDRFTLVAGLHRLRAFEKLGHSTIPCKMSQAQSDEEARLEEVMENLGRGELTALDRCHHLYELKKAWAVVRSKPLSEVLARDGGKTFPTQTEEDEQVFGFAKSVAEKIGLTKRAINMAVKIWTDLTPDSRTRLVGTRTATKQSEIKLLSEQSAKLQVRILDMLLSDPQVASNVSEAIELLTNGTRPSIHERRFESVNKAISSLDDDILDRVLTANEDRVIASLKRRGRI